MGLRRPRPWAVVLSGALLACTWFDEDPFVEKASEGKTRSRPELVELKLERIEACRDQLVPVMTESWDRYGRAVSRGSRASDRDRHFGIDRSNFRACKVGLADGLLMEPPMPELESAASAFVEVAKDYAERSRWEGRADRDNETLQDERLEREYERWQSAWETLDLLLDRARDINGPQLLELVEKRGDDLALQAMAVRAEARPLATCLLGEPSPVAAVCEPLAEAFSIHYEAFRDQIERAGTRDVFWLDSFATTAAAFEDEAADAMRKLKERRLQDADRTRLRRTHRDLVRDAKTLTFEFP